MSTMQYRCRPARRDMAPNTSSLTDGLLVLNQQLLRFFRCQPVNIRSRNLEQTKVKLFPNFQTVLTLTDHHSAYPRRAHLICNSRNPKDWTKWFECMFCREGSGQESETPEFPVWSDSSIRESSAAATFPNEKGLRWTSAEGVVDVCCLPGCCCGDATGSPTVALSLILRTQDKASSTYLGVGAYGYCLSSGSNYTEKRQ